MTGSASCGTPRRPSPRPSGPATAGSPTTWPWSRLAASSTQHPTPAAPGNLSAPLRGTDPPPAFSEHPALPQTRYRQPRFNNRTRASGWLPPSIMSRLQNTLTWVRRLSKLLPVESVHVETSIFDPQLLRNPEIKGTSYQQGPLYRTNLRSAVLRSAVLQRDGNRCVYCNRTGRRQRLELDHAIPKSEGGPERYDNLVAACRTCNQKRRNLPLEQSLRRRPKKLATVNAKLGMDLVLQRRIAKYGV